MLGISVAITFSVTVMCTLFFKCFANIDESLRVTNKVLNQIWNDWKVDEYPIFLVSSYMPHHSYELLKHRFKRVINNAISVVKEQNDMKGNLKFVISFMGSSVTAGHDSPINMSFPVVTANLMKPSFDSLGIDLEVRNVAMGNNPCMPYDACSETFSGHDADIIHWEQSYNCFPFDEGEMTRGIFETFTRQIALMQNRPIIVFSDSNTPNWHAQDCPKDHLRNVTQSNEEMEALRAIKDDRTGLRLFTHTNSKIMNTWGAMKNIVKHYPSTGIQFFIHGGYEKYKCKGPYISEWGCCSASWHPSRTGHALRGAHHAYTWLTIWRAALVEFDSKFKSHKRNFITKQQFEKHLLPIHDVIPKQNLVDNVLGDSKIKCFTDFEPHYDSAANLSSILLPSSIRSNWKKGIMENVFFPNARIVDEAKKKGYADFKWMLYGSKTEGPLYLDLKLHQKGRIMLCQPPGSWGKIPALFSNLWSNDTVDVYITPDVHGNSKLNFQFTQETIPNSIKYYLINPRPKDGQSVCAYTDKEVQRGSHILSLIPLTEKFVMLSTLLTP